jgi:hypothetical protein
MTLSRYVALGKDARSLVWLTEHLPYPFVPVTTPEALASQREAPQRTLFLVDDAAPEALAQMVSGLPHVLWLGRGRTGQELAKPFALADLLGLLARAGRNGSVGLTENVQFIQDSQRLTGEKASIALTDREANLLSYLAARRGKAVEREELSRNIWGFHAALDTHTLETHIYRLRGKLAEAGAPASLIETVDGGYRLA